MKRKITKIWGVGLTIVLAASLLLSAAPASAGDLSWGTETIPSDTGKVILEGSDVLDLAVGPDGTIYAATNIPQEGSFEVTTDSTLDIEADFDGATTGTVEGDLKATTSDLVGDFTADITFTTTFVFPAPAPDIVVIDRMLISGTVTETSLTFSGTIEALQDLGTNVVTDITVAIIDGTISVSTGGVVTITTPLTGTVVDADPPVEVSIVTAGDPVSTMAMTPVLCKSTNGGESWSGLSLPDGTIVDLVAVAPDDEDVVAVVGVNNKVSVSTNGGSSWSSLGIPGVDINDIAVSPESSGNHFIAVAGLGANSAEIWHYELHAVGAKWVETSTLGTGFEAGPVAAAVAFSPNFASDQVMVAVTEVDPTAEITEGIKFQIFSFNQKKWNLFDNYPVDLTVDEAPLTFELESASIALSPDYLGSDDSMRLAFVGLNTGEGATAPETSGIQRLDDTDTKVLKDEVAIHSIAFDGTNLVAGKSDGNTVYYCADPLASSPSVKSSSSLKSPGGEKSMVVAWAGSDVVAGTSGDESAFAVSRNDGKTFNDLSLIDTALTTLEDVAVSADGKVVYLVTDNGENGDLSLWRKASSWERVLSRQNVVEDGSSFIVRLAPEDSDVVYLAQTGGTAKTIYYTTTGGDTKWFTRTCRYPIQDLAIESADVAYIAEQDTTMVSRTTNSGFTWSSHEDSKLGGNVYSIASLGEDKLIVGSVDGYVAYSIDGNESWTKIDKQLDVPADVQVTASGLRSGDFIYAATAKLDTATLVERWEIGESTSWKDMEAPTVVEDTGDAAEYGAFGIALQDGVLYVALEDDTVGETSPEPASRIVRTLNPTADEPTWSTMDKDVAFNRQPSALRVSTGSTKLWAIDNAAEEPELYSYTDTLAAAGPTLKSPSDGATIEVNPVSGKVYDVSFTWARPSKAKIYDLQIALDSDFNKKVKKVEDIASTSSTVAQVVGPGGDELLSYMPETTYYWRVRTSGPIFSPWSEVREFTTAALPEAFAPVEIVIPPAPTIAVPPPPAITITPPEIVLPAPPPAPPEIVIPPPPAAPAPITPAYIWAIIIIGAILVIALVVLIVRTRRPV